MQYAIIVESLSHAYDGKRALDNVSLSLPMGKTVGLVGPDGVGTGAEIGADAGGALGASAAAAGAGFGGGAGAGVGVAAWRASGGGGVWSGA